MYGLSGFTKIEYPELPTGNCFHYIYGMSGFAEKLEIHNCSN